MGKKELDQFIEERSKRKNEFRETDWEKKKNEWLEHLQRVYKRYRDDLSREL